MKIPESSPRFQDLFAKITQKGTDLLYKLYAVDLKDDRYFSYADTKYRPVPPEISAIGGGREEWWFRIISERNSKFQKLPFSSLNGENFQFFTDNSDLQLIHNIDLNGGGTLGIHGMLPNENERNKYFISSLIDEAFYSSFIEGAVSTREIAKKMIAEKREPRDKSERMILNNYNTMQLLDSWKAEPLSSELICRIHSHISETTLPPEKLGRYRTADDSNIVLSDDRGNVYHTPCDYKAIDDKIRELCDFANVNADGRNFIHPIIKGIILHFMLAYIHPFFDGNGRTSRALFYWYLLKNNYWAVKFISISRVIMESGNRYYMSFLDTEQGCNDLNFFIKFQLEAIDRAIRSFGDYVARRKAEMRELSQNMETLNDLNDRQKAIALKIIRKPFENAEFTIDSHRGLNAISFETARQDLLDMQKREILSRRKSGRAYVFYPSKDFLAKIESKNQ